MKKIDKKIDCDSCLITKANQKVNSPNIKVSPQRSASLENDILEQIGATQFNPDRDAFIMGRIGAAALGRVLIDREVEVLQDFGAGRKSIIEVHGLPLVGADVATFCGLREDPDEVKIHDIVHLGLLEVAGLQPVGFSYENNGRIFRNVAPTPKTLAESSSHGAKADLGWHTDNYQGYFEEHSDLRNQFGLVPTVLSFTGLRNSDAEGKPVPTRVMEVAKIIERLDETTIAVLSEGNFTLVPAASNNLEPRPFAPLLEFDQSNNPLLRYNGGEGQIVANSNAAQLALDAINKAVEETESAGEATELNIGPSVWAAFANAKVLHARSRFDPGLDQHNWRWLRRAFAIRCAAKGFYRNPMETPFVLN